MEDDECNLVLEAGWGAPPPTFAAVTDCAPWLEFALSAKEFLRLFAVVCEIGI